MSWFDEEGLKDFIKETVTSEVEAGVDAVDFEEKIKDYLPDFDDLVKEKVDEFDFSDAIYNVVQDYDFDDAIEKQVGNYDFSDAVSDALGERRIQREMEQTLQEKVEECLASPEFHAQVREIVVDILWNLLTFKALRQNVKQSVIRLTRNTIKKFRKAA
jgi:hypothetical protein